MRAELLKIRAMPTPFWTGVSLLLCFLAGIIASVIWGIGDDALVLDLAVNVPTSIAALVLGSWLAGVEFGQNTMRRIVSADPRRERLVFAKLGALLSVVVVVTLVLEVLGAAIFSLAATGHGASIGVDQAFRATCSALVFNCAYAITALSLTLLVRSMAGGMTLTLVFFFVIDGLLSSIPKVGDFMVGVALSDIDLAIRGEGEGPFDQSTVHDPWLATIILAVWLAAFFAAGMIRTTSSDIK